MAAELPMDLRRLHRLEPHRHDPIRLLFLAMLEGIVDFVADIDRLGGLFGNYNQKILAGIDGGNDCLIPTVSKLDRGFRQKWGEAMSLQARYHQLSDGSDVRAGVADEDAGALSGGTNLL